jgi:hypothetical protein
LFPKLGAFRDFYLAGGTALALQLGHRVSVDFDLFHEASIDDALLSVVKQVLVGSSVETAINNPDELTVFVRGVKVTFLSYPFPVLQRFVRADGIKMLSIKEIGATKAYTIGRRGTYKDYVDLYFILSGAHATLDEIIQMADRKFTREFNSRLFAEQLLFMDDIRDYAIKFLGSPVKPEQIRDFFIGELRRFSLA